MPVFYVIVFLFENRHRKARSSALRWARKNIERSYQHLKQTDKFGSDFESHLIVISYWNTNTMLEKKEHHTVKQAVNNVCTINSPDIENVNIFIFQSESHWVAIKGTFQLGVEKKNCFLNNECCLLQAPFLSIRWNFIMFLALNRIALAAEPAKFVLALQWIWFFSSMKLALIHVTFSVS